MKPLPAPPPRLALGITSLELPVRSTRDRALDVTARFRERESLAVALVKAIEAGATAILTPPTGPVRAALAALRRPVPLLVRLPHTPPDDDLRWEPALIAEGDDAGARAWLPGPMRADLAWRVAHRGALDVAGLPQRAIAGAMIAAPYTDLALAAAHAPFFERVLRTMRRRFPRVGFETRNLGALIERLDEWGIAPDFVTGDVNPAGLGMRPDPLRTLAAIERTELRVLATELRAGGSVPLEAGARFALEHGAWGLVPELVDVDDVPRELRALAPLLQEQAAATRPAPAA